MKRGLFLFFLLLLIGSSASASELRAHFTRAISGVLEIMKYDATESIPLPKVTLSHKSARAFAEFRSRNNTIYFFATPLKKWFKKHSQLSPTQADTLLASCLTPVFTHELSHAQNHHFGASHGFAWPVTLEDEFIATAQQVATIHQLLQTHPSYIQDCAEFLPPTDWLSLSSAELKEAVYEHYQHVLGRQTPPPALTPQNAKILFQGNYFILVPHHLSLQKFLKKGGNWTHLSSDSLKKFFATPFYADFATYSSKREKDFFF